MKLKASIALAVAVLGILGGISDAALRHGRTSGGDMDHASNPIVSPKESTATTTTPAPQEPATLKPSTKSATAEIELGTGIFASLPKTLSELVNNADLIVVGKIGPIVNQEMYYGSGADAARLEAEDKASGTHLGLPIVDYSVDVERVLFDGVSLGGVDPVFRLYGYPGMNTDLPEIGERYLLFLKKDPSSGTFGLQSIMHRISLDGPIPTFRFGQEKLPFLTKRTTPEEFITQIAGLAEKRQQAESDPAR
jgi:hypothetical protein